MSKSISPTAVKSTPKSATKGEVHAYERKSDTPCPACGSEYVHSGGFCSRCYNLARKPKAQGLKGEALIAAVKEKLAGVKQPKAGKPSATKKRTETTASPVTVDDALASNAELYGQPAAEQPGALPE